MSLVIDCDEKDAMCSEHGRLFSCLIVWIFSLNVIDGCGCELVGSTVIDYPDDAFFVG